MKFIGDLKKNVLNLFIIITFMLGYVRLVNNLLWED